MIKTLATVILATCTVIAASASAYAGPYDWKVSYDFEVVNPARKLIQVDAKYTFPSITKEVTFQMDNEDNHYTEGYCRHVRAFSLKDGNGNDVEFITDTTGIYRASGLKGTYSAQYIVVMDHVTRAPSKLGPDDTPIMWGRNAVFPGASVVIYPWDADGSTIGEIEINLKLPPEQTSLAPYEKTGDNSYRVPSMGLLKSEFWAIGEFDSFVYETGGDSVICAVSREGLRFGLESIKPAITSVLDFYTALFGSLPAHRMSMSVIGTPSSKNLTGFRSFGSVGTRSFNCLIDEKVGPKDLGSQMGLVAYNVLSFWTPSHFRPASLAKLDWFTTATLNYMQVKSSLRLGFIDEAAFLGNLSRAYSTYVDQHKRRGLSLSVLTTLPNSPDRSVYGFMMCAMFDLLLHTRSGGEQGIESILRRLNDEYGGATGYTEEGLYTVFRETGVPEIDSLIATYVQSATFIDLSPLLEPCGLTVSLVPSGAPEIGLRLAGAHDLTVEWVDRDGAAGEGGIDFGDVLKEMRGFKLSTASDLPKLISDLGPGDEVEVVYLRGGETMTTTIELGERMTYRVDRAAAMSAEARQLWSKYREL